MRRLISHLATAMLPKRCACCGTPLTSHEDHWCGPCAFDWTRCYGDQALRFSGRLDLAFGWSWLQNGPRKMESALVHRLKYGNQPDLGIQIGCAMASEYPKPKELLLEKWAVIPIPLHPRKERRRGFNQSHMLAKGWAKAEGMKVVPALDRPSPGRSLTQLKRAQRLAQTQGMFTPKIQVESNWTDSLQGCIIMDDVITTGATIEAAYLAIRQVWPGPLGFITLLDATR